MRFSFSRAGERVLGVLQRDAVRQKAVITLAAAHPRRRSHARTDV
jgi:hypothetical protein